MALHTIATVFNNCRFFRDHPPSTEDGSVDFANLVAFCKKLKGEWTFREPIEADFLSSQARRQHLKPEHEVDVRKLTEGLGVDNVLREEHAAFLQREQYKSAHEHWKIMRSLLPDAVWELW